MKSLGKRHVLKQKVIRESSTWWQSWKLCPFFFKKKKKRLFIWAIFTLFIEFVTILLLFYVLVFGQKACGILVPQPAVEPAPPALEGKS